MAGRAVLVTGGARGIGAAAARRFAAQGASVTIADRDAGPGEAVAAEIGGRFVATDVGLLEDNERAAAVAARESGGLDVVLLNAGIPGRCGLSDFSAPSYRDTMRTNLDGVVYGLHACLPHLRARGGAVVVTSSLAGLTGSADLFYATSKHALIGLVRSAAPRLAADGIRINAFCPGLVDTEAIAAFRPELDKAGLSVADPGAAAEAIQTILDQDGTGAAWLFQAGGAAQPLPDVEIPLTAGQG